MVKKSIENSTANKAGAQQSLLKMKSRNRAVQSKNIISLHLHETPVFQIQAYLLSLF